MNDAAADDAEADAMQWELIDWVERFLKTVPCPDWEVEHLREVVWQEPGEAAGTLLGGYVLGHWDLDPDELARLWFLGRGFCGYFPEELLPNAVLADAVPGREHRPADPVHPLVLHPPKLAGGGHGPGRGIPGKREFPSTWTDDDAIRQTMDVARHPSGTSQLPDGSFRAWGERAGVVLAVIVSAQGGVRTSYPLEGEGVVQHPLDDERASLVAPLLALVDQLVPRSDSARGVIDELAAVGEWPHVVTNLRARDAAMTDEQRAVLDEAARHCGPLPF